MDIDPNYVEAVHDLAHAYVDAGKLDEAIAMAHRLTELTPEDPMSFTGAVSILPANNMVPEAESAAAKARMLDWKRQLLRKKQAKWRICFPETSCVKLRRNLLSDTELLRRDFFLMSHMNSNGVNLYYEEHGNGEPLILIMGFTVSSIGWHWNVPAFAQDFRTIVFDNRGVGQSDKPDVPYSMQMFADDTAGLLDGLDVEQAHVFGISMGGMIAQEFALRHSKRVKTLTLGCTHCGGTNAVLSKDPDVLNMLGNIESVDVQQAALAMTKVAVTPWFMQNHTDMLIQLNQVDATPDAETRHGAPDASDSGHDTYERLPLASYSDPRGDRQRGWACTSGECSVTLAQRIPNRLGAVL